MMILKVCLKQIGERKAKIAPIEFEYTPVPATTKDLIRQTAEMCVTAYNRRFRAGEKHIAPLSEEKISDMASVGKIAFGINYGPKEQPLQPATENALQAFRDGIYRVFLNGEELTNLEQEICLRENDLLTFIKLTMLSGRMW